MNVAQYQEGQIRARTRWRDFRERGGLRRTGIAVVYVLGIFALWEAFVALFGIRSYLLPAPTAIWAAAVEDGEVLLRHSGITVLETIFGFGLAAVVGVALAALIIHSGTLAFLLIPTLVATNATPKVAVAPILIIWLGLGVESKVAMAFLLSFFPIVINAIRGLGDVPEELLELFRLLKASRWETFIKVRLPNSLPSMFDGFKIALPLALIGAIVGEFVGSRDGIGRQMLIGYSNFNTPLVFAAVILVAVIATLLFQALAIIERLAMRWKPGVSG